MVSSEDPRQTAYTVGLTPAVTLYTELDEVVSTLLDGRDELTLDDGNLTLHGGKWRRPTELTYNGWTHPIGSPQSILNADQPYDVLEALRGVDAPLRSQWEATLERAFPELNVADYIDTAQANLDNVGQTANTGDVYYDLTEGRTLGALRAYVKHPALADDDAVLTQLVKSGVPDIAFVDEQQLVARTYSTIRRDGRPYTGVAIRRSPVAGRGFEAHPVNVGRVVPSGTQYSGLLIRENGYIPSGTVFDTAGNRTDTAVGHVIDELIITQYEADAPAVDGATQRRSSEGASEQTATVGNVRISVTAETPVFNTDDESRLTMHLQEPMPVRFECNGCVSGTFEAGTYTFEKLPYA